MSIVIEENVMVPMRDGVKLAVDIYRPAQEGRWPVLLTRLPYDKDRRFPFPAWKEKRVFLELNVDSNRLVEAGYVVVAQDTRGRFASEGEFEPFTKDAEDGADTIAWLTCQPWSSGSVGMFGVSYQALTQWQAASQRPEALKAIAPSQAPGWGLYPYQGGAFMLFTALTWAVRDIAQQQIQRLIGKGQATTVEAQAIAQALEELPALYPHLPLVDLPVLRKSGPFYFDWLEHPNSDAYWRETLPEGFYELVSVPVLVIAGWYDAFLSGDLRAYQRLKQRGGGRQAREQQHLVVGPWSHGNFKWGFKEREYGVASHAGELLTNLHLRWFDHWLKGSENGIEQEKPVHIFVMGTDRWRDEESWPLPNTQYRPYYLHSQGHANSATGDGLLSLAQAKESEAEDRYVYDPRNPVPTTDTKVEPDSLGDRGPFDQREIEAREDVLCYTSEPLEQPLEVIGNVELVLYVSSSTPDTDFTGKLVDLYPDGRAEILTDGILRARYRQSRTEPVMMEADQVYELHIDLGATANVFLAGHSIRLEVSSSNFPRFDRNTNTGGTIAYEREEDLLVATNRVYHRSSYPSHLILPVIEQD